MTDPKYNLRPIIPTIVDNEGSSPEERFQNEVIRPIIKLQHELLVCYFSYFVQQKKVNLDDLDLPKTVAFISKSFKTDTNLKSNLKGLVIGMFTLDEFNVYLTMLNQLNKRITTILESRIISVYEDKHLNRV